MINIQRLLIQFFQSKSPLTVRSYKSDLEKFRQHLDLKTKADAIQHLLDAPHSQANLIVLHYKVKLLKNGTRPVTINRRLSTLRSLVSVANQLGYLHWQLDVNNEPLTSTKSTQKKDELFFQKLLETSKKQKNPLKASRDLAILRLLHDLALKRHSITQLNLSDLNSAHKTISVEIKGHTEKVVKRLPSPTLNCLTEWVAMRGSEPGPLFINFDHAGKGRRLSGSSIYRIVRQFGQNCGVIATPQIVRNSAIRKALKLAEKEGIRPNEFTLFSGHKNSATLQRFKRQKLRIQSSISDMIAE